MKRGIFLILNILMGIVLAYPQTGIWSGDLEVQGTKLPIVFHLDDANPTIDSPAQRVKGIPMQLTRVAPDSIFIKIPAIGATYAGKYKDNEIIGTFTQSGMTFPLTLLPGEKIAKRPQTPKPPYPYVQEEVSFTNGDAVLRGTLTLPEGYNQETPVLIMITGSGLQDRDEEILDHKPFAVIADALARNGIASLRYDDRGFGESTGDAVNCTTEDLMYDALSGINLLCQRFNKVGVLGHSEGGTIAFMLGADKKVDFIISLAGMIVAGKETLLDQNRYFLSQAGYPEEVVEEYCRLLTSAFEGDETLQQKLSASAVPTELKQNVQAALGQLKTPYMQYFLMADIRPDLGNVDCPVLAINGTKDIQVFYENNLEALKRGLPTNNLNQIMALDGLNHLLQHCSTGSTNEYATIEETISPEVLEIICQWIKSLQGASESSSDIWECYPDPSCEFPGGMVEMLKWLKENIRIPEGFAGRERVVVKYTVQPDGTVVDGKIFKGSENEKLNTEALRLVAALPKFEVTYYTSDKYPIYFTWPITFEKDSIQ